MSADEFIKKYYPVAKRVELIYNVPALSCLAQSALETGWGKSMPGNMAFGIKADASWKGEKQLLSTKEVINGKVISTQSYFRKYQSVEHSFLDYALFLKENKRYKKAFDYKEPLLFSKEIAKAGYATDPTYLEKISKIIDIIKKKNLTV